MSKPERIYIDNRTAFNYEGSKPTGVRTTEYVRADRAAEAKDD